MQPKHVADDQCNVNILDFQARVIGRGSIVRELAAIAPRTPAWAQDDHPVADDHVEQFTVEIEPHT